MDVWTLCVCAVKVSLPFIRTRPVLHSFPLLIPFSFSSLLLQNKREKGDKKRKEKQNRGNRAEKETQSISSHRPSNRICIIWLPFLFVVLIQPVCLSVSPTVSAILNHLRKLCCPATLKRQTTETTGLTL